MRQKKKKPMKQKNNKYGNIRIKKIRKIKGKIINLKKIRKIKRKTKRKIKKIKMKIKILIKKK